MVRFIYTILNSCIVLDYWLWSNPLLTNPYIFSFGFVYELDFIQMKYTYTYTYTYTRTIYIVHIHIYTGIYTL